MALRFLRSLGSSFMRSFSELASLSSDTSSPNAYVDLVDSLTGTPLITETKILWTSRTRFLSAYQLCRLEDDRIVLFCSGGLRQHNRISIPGNETALLFLKVLRHCLALIFVSTSLIVEIHLSKRIDAFLEENPCERSKTFEVSRPVGISSS